MANATDCPEALAGTCEMSKRIQTVPMVKSKRCRERIGQRWASTAPGSEHDRPWKEAPDRDFEPCQAFFFPNAHADIDWARGCEMLDKELQPIVRWRSTAAAATWTNGSRSGSAPARSDGNAELRACSVRRRS
jgi:hypothetical protein